MQLENTGGTAVAPRTRGDHQHRHDDHRPRGLPRWKARNDRRTVVSSYTSAQSPPAAAPPLPAAPAATTAVHDIRWFRQTEWRVAYLT